MNGVRTMPRFDAASGMQMDRARFLSGDLRAFFGPGQTPLSPLTYAPPIDWSKAGTLLRPPRQVWVSINFGTLVPETFAVVDHMVGGVLIDGVPAYRDEHFPHGLAGPYRRVRAAVEAFLADLYEATGGRVGVTLIDTTLCPTGNDFLPTDRVNFPTGNDVTDFGGGGVVWDGFRDGQDPVGPGPLVFGELPAPPPESEDYFGVDFLHVYIGSPSYWLDATSAPSPDIRNYWDAISGLPPRSRAEAIVAAAQSRIDYSGVADAAAKFAGYACRMFGREAYKLNRSWAGYSSEAIGITSSIRYFPTVFRDTRSFPADDEAATLAAECLLLAESGFAYGGTSDAVDGELLKNIVTDRWPDLADALG